MTSLDPAPSVSEIRVRYSETDQMGVVYHANYLIWCEIGRTDFIRHHGMSYAEMERSGISLAVSEATLRFHASARYDDVVHIETTLTDVKSRLLVFDYLITNVATGDRLATARTSLISISRAGRPLALPAAIRSRLERVRAGVAR